PAAAESASGSTSQPRTSSTPASRAASPTEAPIKSVPTTASVRTTSVGAHQLGDAEREVERLACVQPRVAERHVARVELGLLHVLGAAEAFGHVLARELEVHAAGPRARLAMRGEEALDLAQHVVEVPRLPSPGAGEDVRVHRIADPDDGMLGVPDGAQERRQQLEDTLRAHARDQRQASWHTLRIQSLAELERLFRRRGRPELDPDR